MTLPKKYSGLAKLLIAIAENGNEYKHNVGQLTENDCLNFGEVIADIQNWCGENRETLEKLNLQYDSEIK